MRQTIALFGFVALLNAAGCAAVFNDSLETVHINSNPPGAAVVVDGVPVGNTPLAAQLANDMPHQVQVSAPGYQPVAAVIGSSLGAGWLILDIFLGGLIGIIIDASTDAWLELDTDSIFFNLVPAQGSVVPQNAPFPGKDGQPGNVPVS